MSAVFVMSWRHASLPLDSQFEIIDDRSVEEVKNAILSKTITIFKDGCQYKKIIIKELIIMMYSTQMDAAKKA